MAPTPPAPVAASPFHPKGETDEEARAKAIDKLRAALEAANALRVHGPLVEDYVRAIKAAKRMGWKVVRVEIGKSHIAILADDAYLDKLASGQPPAPSSEMTEAERRKLDLV